MRILSWNVNGVRAVTKKGMLDWLDREQPDILCIQESKAQPDQLAKKLLNPKGYQGIWHSAERKGYSGTATFTKHEPLSVSVMGREEFDVEGRVQVLEFKDFTLINAYYPNSRPERARIQYKLDFCDAMLDVANELKQKGKNVVICGDYNIAHTEIDLARPKQNENNPGYYIEEREAMTAFLEQGYVDTFRHFHPDEKGHYSWWSYRAKARERNVGWRIDYHCVNKEFIDRVRSARILPEVMGSDHCPVEIDLFE